jgi:serine/threonine-protein kinase
MHFLRLACTFDWFPRFPVECGAGRQFVNESQQPAGVKPGDILAGKYRVERVLGAGGMGVVVAAHHIQLDEKVALKFLLPEALGSEEAVNRFVREARSAVKIKSEHVARVSDVGQLETGAPYMVMEFLDGTDLQAMLSQQGPMPMEQAAEFILQACEAIAEAHALGIVHRDLKPANLFCIRRADGLLSIKVLDFGISKAMTPGSASSGGMTRTAAIVGSPLYMSPEQMASSKSVDPRTDIWSLGVILFELVAGRPPFEGDDMMGLMMRIATGAPLSLLQLRPDVPKAFEDVVMRCLEKDRQRRIQNVGELAVALGPFAPQRALGSVDRISRTMSAIGVRSSPSVPGLQVAPGTAPGTISGWGRTGGAQTGTDTIPKSSSGKLVAIIAAVVGLAAIGGGVVILTRGKSPDTQTGAASGGTAAATSAPASVSAAPAASSAVVAAQPSEVLAPLASASSVKPPSEPTKPATATGTKPGGNAIHTTPAGSAATHPNTTTTAKPNCDPPYYFDANGTRVFKKECL